MRCNSLNLVDQLELWLDWFRNNVEVLLIYVSQVTSPIFIGFVSPVIIHVGSKFFTCYE